ncbi:pyruvate dehydrogenase E2 component (dihydrolipoamide acetyltransferase) [Candidatus Pantoea symbiotica]|jgi:pyruvate dehydrogenase E2 component (dihydrolipoamide acetyltransferase)|uniref:Acetyltransferase component of pyruvate dehydrogenase complex n=1 Tax=Candidatus Pantoea symbiotica TaxID=1884370 RepID=A0A1I3XWE1_9GAMM|nr:MULTISPECIES: pyruvate dehydrogenase complex dihydrolipoyllysine-residue acetyltransferase [Pantoea]KAJ9434209.1 pyruvate dehydrogenase complex dihydrolipoyllysine-residue acetyltransferase [Pantoea sp. YR343]MRT24035.1 pyruvate dehydrogenase complex dihydrolipoyllysine-residue acetyltransferase [Enterobacteriaceae bacterium RIT697]SFK23381.1 pyruvate dehydrogenase E2 component (dihydrolipoamide acetyltransferase) [Pantoea symbiotica]SFU82145.1 pyruvate dehydrogenase E2 component (dihydrolip
MAIEINVPDIGADEVEVTEILVKVGDKVEAEQSLITVEGDKASMEVPSPQAGVVKEIKISTGDKVETGKLIMIFEAEGAAEAAPAPAEEKKAEAAPAPAAAAAAVSKEVNVPDIGGDEVEVTEILVKVGDKVAAEQSLITVEGDKASMEVPAPFAGVVKEIKIATGDKVITGSLIMVFEAEGAAPAAAAPAAKQEAAPAAAPAASGAKDVNVPDIGGDEVEVTEILVKVGDKVAAEQSLIVVEGDKASMEVPAPFAGTVKELKVATGDKVSTGKLIMVFEVEGAAPAAAPAAKQEAAPAAEAAKPAAAPAAAKADAKGEFAENDAYVHATPVIRRLAREFGVNLAKVKGTGRKGRILKEDVQTYVKDAVKRAEAAPAAAASGGSLPGLLPWPKVDFSKFGEIEEVELGRIQKISGANLSRNWVVIPHVTHFDKTDITDLEAFRKQQNAEAEKRKLDVKFTPVVFIMKAVAAALEQMPRFNSSLSEDAQKLTLKKYINIGVAVDTPNGLVVPVFKDVNKKGITELSRELMAISKKARDGKLTAGDMQGGCFTISSLGGLGTTHFAPIVNAPEVAILGVSKSAMEPVWNGKEFEPRLMMPISLSFDHRVIDGADGARFITIINNTLSDIRRLVM